MLCLMFLSPLELTQQPRTAGERNHTGTILPYPLCNLGIICVALHGNFSISEHF